MGYTAFCVLLSSAAKTPFLLSSLFIEKLLMEKAAFQYVFQIRLSGDGLLIYETHNYILAIIFTLISCVASNVYLMIEIISQDLGTQHGCLYFFSSPCKRHRKSLGFFLWEILVTPQAKKHF